VEFPRHVSRERFSTHAIFDVMFDPTSGLNWAQKWAQRSSIDASNYLQTIGIAWKGCRTPDLMSALNAGHFALRFTP